MIHLGIQNIDQHHLGVVSWRCGVCPWKRQRDDRDPELCGLGRGQHMHVTEQSGRRSHHAHW